MPPLTTAQLTALAALGEETEGLWTLADAVTALSRGRVHGLVASGTWTEVWPGVLTDGGGDLDPQRATRAASMSAGPRGAAAGRTAARYWGIPLVDDHDPATRAFDHLHSDIAVAARRITRTMPDGRVLHARRTAVAEDDIEVTGEIRVLKPLPTLWDLARLVSHEALVCAVDDALHRELVTRAELVALGVERAGHEGAPAFVAAVSVADGRAESPLETLGRLLLLPAIPTLVPQVRLYRGSRTLARLDLADPGACFGVEADGMSVHGRPAAVAQDRKRTDLVAGVGWLLSRFTWWDARRDQVAFVARTVREWERAKARC